LGGVPRVGHWCRECRVPTRTTSTRGRRFVPGIRGRARWWPPRPSSGCAPTSRAENTRSLSKTKTIKMTTTTLTKGSDGRDCGAWCPPCSGAAQYGDPLAAFDPLTEGIRSYHDAGNTTNMLLYLFRRTARTFLEGAPPLPSLRLGSIGSTTTRTFCSRLNLSRPTSGRIASSRRPLPPG
jgi:hypothetical protein